MFNLRRDLKACRNCAYLALEPGHDGTDICTHLLSGVADVTPGHYCEWWDNTLNLDHVCGYEPGIPFNTDGMPNVREKELKFYE